VATQLNSKTSKRSPRKSSLSFLTSCCLGDLCDEIRLQTWKSSTPSVLSGAPPLALENLRETLLLAWPACGLVLRFCCPICSDSNAILVETGNTGRSDSMCHHDLVRNGFYRPVCEAPSLSSGLENHFRVSCSRGFLRGGDAAFSGRRLLYQLILTDYLHHLITDLELFRLISTTNCFTERDSQNIISNTVK
jgi:hypothetical protein